MVPALDLCCAVAGERPAEGGERVEITDGTSE